MIPVIAACAHARRREQACGGSAGGWSGVRVQSGRLHDMERDRRGRGVFASRGPERLTEAVGKWESWGRCEGVEGP